MHVFAGTRVTALSVLFHAPRQTRRATARAGSGGRPA
ncbi:MAG: hypothetical protein QG622_153 [Actinomycetota bacterium]|nr:hypothetical protein [Actinomycetota bacterium]